MSPYATGGGGVTFERKVAVQYLAHLLVGDGAAELGDGRFVVSVAFQQAPKHSVDDLVIRAARADELEPSLDRSQLQCVAHPTSCRATSRPRSSSAPSWKRSSTHQSMVRSIVLRSSSQAPKTTPSNWRRSPVSPPSRWTRRASSPLFARQASFLSGIQGRLEQIEALVELALIDLASPPLAVR